ncbi:broad specificity phosphatase PhoE/thiol-disulfide isomerase/thioredoxin [Agromyces ramosus]|uniref:Broad specificity phosphatase PhoE/thiol-disulfide isomerase/thioredoxin n=2 Tax=Agromyces ramosus TaxID=33879 RepID=A0ABU0R916_9MICO|nr:broad specificity phosphatase PhoE/thiol-disulfide isomerase/thioredoxin [Agromyces ramosus]
MPADQIHLVRHGEVFNPQGVLYGRLPGYGLSDLGRRMAQAAADDLLARDRHVRSLVVSPLQRTRQSAEPVAAAFGLDAVLDDRVIEPENRFEGKRMRGRAGALRDLRNWPLLVNPWEPSWGEPFRSISARMLRAITEAWQSTDDGDVVIVSHQLPIWMVHRSVGGLSLSHDPRRRRCALSSITTLERRGDGNGFVEVGYADPAAGLAAEATDVGGGVMGRRWSTLALVAASVVVLTGCTSDPLADQFREGSGKNYIAGDGTITEYALESRGDPIEFSGETVEGESYDSADAAGRVQVVNFWYAGCAPCRVEAPILQEVHEGVDPDDVSFVGVNVRDQAANAASFEQSYGITYPSILDVESGEAQLAFAGPVPPAAVPTTIVLDREGRVAARVLGQLKDASILESIIDDLLAEQA